MGEIFLWACLDVGEFFFVGKFGRRRVFFCGQVWASVSFFVGEFTRGRGFLWASLDVGEFGHGRI